MIFADWIDSDVLDAAGISSSAKIRRGKCVIATAESRTSSTFGTLTTPDQIAGITLPSDGLLFVGYHATWEASGGAAANPRAAIFLNGNQLKYDAGGTSPIVQEALGTQIAGSKSTLGTFQAGLLGQSTGANDYAGDVSTGQVFGPLYSNVAGPVYGGGLCPIFAAAGDYDVSVRFKSDSGSVTARNRKLWVWTMS